MAEEKILKCDELTFLEDLKIFSECVKNKIYLENYTVKESYAEISKEKEDGEEYIKINEDKCYDNKITLFVIKVNPSDNSIISYKADGPAIFSYVKPYTKSTPYISNRESMSIGYKASTGDIMNTTKVFDHLIMDKINDYPLYMTKEFFKGDEKDKDHPHLHTIMNTRFTHFEQSNNESLYSPAIEELTTIDNDGNILDFTKAEVLYASTVHGENIKINHKYKYMSSENDKDNIIPKWESDENTLKVTYVRMRDPYKILGEEYFDITDNKTLSPIYIDNQFAEIFIDDDTRCTAKTRIGDSLYTVESNCNFPLSGDIFMFSEYKGNVTFAMSSYFKNIYDTQVGGLVFLTDSEIYRISATDNPLKDEEKYSIDYEYDDYGVINSQLYKSGDNQEEQCKYNTDKLPNGNIIIESCIYAEPVFPINKKSIFYRAVEIDKNTNEIISDYRALIVNQKDYS